MQPSKTSVNNSSKDGRLNRWIYDANIFSNLERYCTTEVVIDVLKLKEDMNWVFKGQSGNANLLIVPRHTNNFGTLY
jgi:hypothetical protein